MNKLGFHLLPDVWLGSDQSQLEAIYARAFSSAEELYVVSAFLTEWPSNLTLNSKCKVFKLVVGADFGTTRVAALEAALAWLPRRFRGQMLAFNGRGVSFHPKAVLWREFDGSCHFLVGSSNLTRAAFRKNVEANVTLRLNEQNFKQVRAWMRKIENRSVEVNRQWISRYEEAPPRLPTANSRTRGISAGDDEAPVFDLSLSLEDEDEIKLFKKQLASRRKWRAKFDSKAKEPLDQLFRRTAMTARWGEREKKAFFKELRDYWSVEAGTQMGGTQWIRTGKHTNNRELARSMVAIIDASDEERDSVVVEQRDRLHKAGVATRAAVLSELLCHFFPASYPILDQPVRAWRSKVGFDKGVGGTEGERYLRLARAMRAALEESGPQKLGVRDLAELDLLIWFKGRQ